MTSSNNAEALVDSNSIENLIASSVKGAALPSSVADDKDFEALMTPAPMSLRPPISGRIAAVNSLAPPSKGSTREEALAVHINRNDWLTVARELGPLNETKTLSPTLGLLAAIAHNEVDKEGQSESVAIAIRCTAKLLAVPEESPIARVVARRLIRKNPTGISERDAPPAKTGATIVLVTAVIGAGIGWLMSGGWGVVRTLVMHVLK